MMCCTVHEASEFEKYGKIMAQLKAQRCLHFLLLPSDAYTCFLNDQNQKKSVSDFSVGFAFGLALSRGGTRCDL